MKEKLYDILSDYNEILKDIDAFINVLEIELQGIEDTPAIESIKNIVRVHLRLLRAIQTDSDKLYNRIDELILDIHKGGI